MLRLLLLARGLRSFWQRLLPPFAPLLRFPRETGRVEWSPLHCSARISPLWIGLRSEAAAVGWIACRGRALSARGFVRAGCLVKKRTRPTTRPEALRGRVVRADLSGYFFCRARRSDRRPMRPTKPSAIAGSARTEQRTERIRLRRDDGEAKQTVRRTAVRTPDGRHATGTKPSCRRRRRRYGSR